MQVIIWFWSRKLRSEWSVNGQRSCVIQILRWQAPKSSLQISEKNAPKHLQQLHSGGMPQNMPAHGVLFQLSHIGSVGGARHPALAKNLFL